MPHRLAGCVETLTTMCFGGIPWQCVLLPGPNVQPAEEQMDCGPVPSDPHAGSLSQVHKLFFHILGMFLSALPYYFPLYRVGAYATGSFCEPLQGSFIAYDSSLPHTGQQVYKGNCWW